MKRGRRMRVCQYSPACGHLLLLDAIFHLPDFGAVIGTEADNDQLEKRVVGTEIELVMKLRDQGAKFFEKGDADGFQIGGFLTRIWRIVLVVRGLRDALIIAIQANGIGNGRNLPFGCAEEDTDVGGIELQEARRYRVHLDGLIDGGKDDDVVLSDLSDDAAACEAGDDLIFSLQVLSAGDRWQQHGCEENRN